MTYELVKQLKDAGFPVGILGGARCIHTANQYPRMPFSTCCQGCERVYFPTLSEFIEACGDDLAGIRKSAGLWLADAVEKHQPLTPFGSTPEEAVAKLWLALHRNQ